MALNRVQLQRGLPMAEFMDRYGTQEKCESALTASRWPAGFGYAGLGPPVLCRCRFLPSPALSKRTPPKSG